jgi:hypothetical protein
MIQLGAWIASIAGFELAFGIAVGKLLRRTR